MAAECEESILTEAVKKEIMLQLNQELYDENNIPRGVYEQAKLRIVNGTY